MTGASRTPAVHPMEPIHITRRSGPVTMGLLWITMVTAFPTLLIGFEWCKEGFTLSQVVLCTFLSCLMLMVYTIPATQLGARTGLSYTALSRGVFGRWGSRFVTFNLIWVFTVFYGAGALFMTDGLNGLFHSNLPSAWTAAGFAILMSFNNFFGFKGVANFARFIAAPALIGWIAYSFYKAAGACSPGVWTEVPHESFAMALTTISTFVIGFAVWGNEKDYWRFSIPRPAYSAMPLTVALVIGQMLFPTTGWMVAHMTHITDYSAATAFMNNYSFGGVALIGALVLGASYFAQNDSNLFGVIQGCENLKPMPHRIWVAIMTLIGAITAYSLSVLGAAKALDTITSLNCVIMPTPTVIMLTEWFLLANIFKTISIANTRVLAFDELPSIRWPAFIALLCALVVGLATSGAFPGTESLHVGVCSVQAWLTAIIIYIPLRIIEHNQRTTQQTLVIEKVLARRFEQAAARIPIAVKESRVR